LGLSSDVKDEADRVLTRSASWQWNSEADKLTEKGRVRRVDVEVDGEVGLRPLDEVLRSHTPEDLDVNLDGTPDLVALLSGQSETRFSTSARDWSFLLMSFR